VQADPLRPLLEAALRHHQSNQFAEAEKLYQQVLARSPNDSNALHLYGLLAHQTNRLDLAINMLGRAAQISSHIGPFHLHYASALHAAGRIDEAIVAMQRAAQLEPNDPAVRRNLAIALAQAGRVDEAIAHFQAVVDLRPQEAEGYYNLGTAYLSRSRYKDAALALRRAVDMEPDRAEGQCNLGAAYRALWKFDDAIRHYKRALELQPNYPDAWYNLGATYHALIRLPEAMDCYRKALELRPDFHIAHSSILLGMHYQVPFDARAIFEEAKRWDARHGVPRRTNAAHANVRDPERRLRIGYVSADFFQHSVAFFLESILEHHDQTRFEVFCYSSTTQPDTTSKRLQTYVDHWRQVTNVPDERLVQMIRADAIDVLIDLSGHTSHNRMTVFAAKPAPVQVSYLGFPNTTGLSAIDYRLTDPVADPPREGDELYVEKLVRLPRTGWCYRPPVEAPEPAGLPAPTKGFVTFGSFNNLAKVNEGVIAAWAKILRSLPDSRLLIKSPTLEEASVKQRLLDAFSSQGIDPGRLEMIGRIIGYHDHLSKYHQVDLSLDAFAYNGTTTTCESLWMGVPVVTLAGDHHVSRVGLSLLTQVGLGELVARSEEEYVETAVMLARDLDRLTALREGLRERMTESSLCDAERFTREFEEALRGMWRKWCGS